MFNSTLLLICILLGSEESQAYLKRSSHIQIENTEVVINQVFTDSTADIHYLTVQKNKLNFVDGQKIQIFSFTTDILKVSSSDNGQYFAVVTRPQNLVKESGLELHSIQKLQDEQFSLSLPYFYDDPFPEIKISNAGQILVGQTTTNTVTLYSAEGIIILKIELFSTSDYALERSLRLAFSPDGSFFFAAAMREPARPENALTTENVSLFKFDSKGNELWRQALPEQSLGEMQLAPDGSMLAVNSYDAFAVGGILQSTRIISDAGETISQMEGGFRVAEFSTDGTHILLSSKKKAEVYTIETGSMVASAVIPHPQMILSALLHSQNENISLLTGVSTFEVDKFLFKENRLRSYSSAGELISQIPVEGALTSPAKLQHINGDQILLTDARRIEIFRKGAQK
ncbi:MAG: WD40 repeat domain-containing protein [Deferribacteres bacterium]|nr:WD40 repeat domain-containing protein [candidate division KSB1 bacterium]MCB9501097.1 WD40 repeat domain-containing protein [Deferribacteres bacterium]